MSNYNTTLQTNNSSLEEIISQLNNMPDAGSGGGDTSIEDSLIDGTASTYTNNRIKTVRNYAFYGCFNLTDVSFPECTTIGSSAFYSCSNLTSISFLKCEKIHNNAFRNCSNLTDINFPECSIIQDYAFCNCSKLTTVSLPTCQNISGSAFYNCYLLASVNLPMCTSIPKSAFYNCSALKTIYLLASQMCRLDSSTAFQNTGITSTSGSIFVPASLVASYKGYASPWKYFASIIFSASELVE